MTNTNSVWEQAFRQPTDDNVTTELGRLSAQVASVNAKNVQIEGVNNTQQTQIDSKAPIVSPTFTGTPNAPIPPQRWNAGSNQLLTQQGHSRAHACAIWQYSSGAAQSVSGAWSVFNQVGTLPVNTGSSYTLGSGGLGIVIGETGVYSVQVTYQYVVSSHPANPCRVITGVSVNGAATHIVNSETITNLAGVSYVMTEWVGNLNISNVRGMVFSDGGATLSVTPRSLVIRRIA